MEYKKHESYYSYPSKPSNMQSSIKFFTNKRPASVADANSENQYNRGIIQITIPPVENHDVSSLTPSSSSPIRQKIRVIMYASIDCSGSMSDVATCYTNQQRSRDQRQQSTKMNFVHATLNCMKKLRDCVSCL